MRLDTEHKRHGFFWLPENQEAKIPGILSITDGGKIELEIVGHFKNEMPSLKDGNDTIRIVGTIEKFGLITLDRCFYTRRNLSFGGISKSKLHVSRALFGAAWDESEEITFESLSFSIDCLDEWLEITGLQTQSNFEEDTAEIIYKRPDSVSFEIGSGISLEIDFCYNLFGFGSVSESKITQSAYFKIITEKPKQLDEFIGIALKVTNFICFAVDEVLSISNVSAKSESITRKIGRESHVVDIPVYFESSFFSEKKPQKHTHEMLFTFSAIEENSEEIFKNWLAAYEYLQPALDLYFATKGGAQRFLDGKFLALAQALETFHRRTSKTKLMPPKEYKALVKGIVETCPQERKEWLRGRLQHGNEISLADRLREIIEPFGEHIGEKDHREKLVRKIVDTRNYFTHYEEYLKAKSANGLELWVIYQKMEAILSLTLLKELKLGEDSINYIMQTSTPLRRKLNFGNAG